MALDVHRDRDLAYRLGAVALLFTVASLATALAFQYLGGYQPCMLCLMQRYAYYAAIPMLFAALALHAGGRTGWAATLFFLVSLAYLANAGLGVYHAGAEWKFWAGPAACMGEAQLATDAGGLLKQLEQTHVVRCDEPAIRVLGLSFAGWNVLASLLLMALTLRAAFATRH